MKMYFMDHNLGQCCRIQPQNQRIGHKVLCLYVCAWMTGSRRKHLNLTHVHNKIMDGLRTKPCLLGIKSVFHSQPLKSDVGYMICCLRDSKTVAYGDLCIQWPNIVSAMVSIVDTLCAWSCRRYKHKKNTTSTLVHQKSSRPPRYAVVDRHQRSQASLARTTLDNWQQQDLGCEAATLTHLMRAMPISILSAYQQYATSCIQIISTCKNTMMLRGFGTATFLCLLLFSFFPEIFYDFFLSYGF